MAAYKLSLDVPEPVYEQLRQRAANAERSIEEEALFALAEAAPDDLSPDLEALLASFKLMDDDQLWQFAHNRVPAEAARRLAELIERQQRCGLGAKERREAEELADLHDRVLLVRAEAAAQLKRRGFDVTSLLPEG